MKKYFSYSEFYTWCNDRERYYQTYIEGVETPPNDAMILGSIVHETLENPKKEWIKELKENKMHKRIGVVRKLLDKMEPKKIGQPEVSMIAKKDDVKLFSIFDGFDKKNRILNEYKTSDKESWTQWRVDFNKQLSFYAWVYYLNCHSYFREMNLYFLDTKKGNVKTFKTIRSRRDIMLIEKEVLKAVDEIKKAGLWEKRLSREDRNKLNQLNLV